MNINNHFIVETVGAFYKKFMSRQNDWCKIASTEPTIDSYKNILYQMLYALRYIPAYYFEYCILANNLYTRVVSNELYHLNIISFGCGLAPDYYALKDNLRKIGFNYYGYDCVKWSTRKYMPQVEDNFTFKFQNLDRLTLADIQDIDVFVFPKSMGDIYNSSKSIIDHLSSLISLSPKNRIFFMNSFVSKDFNSSIDKNIFLHFHRKLLKNNFSTKDDHNTTYHLKSNSTEQKLVGLKKLSCSFEYPNEYLITCERSKMDPECTYCNVTKSPILTNQFMDYQLLEYRRYI